MRRMPLLTPAFFLALLLWLPATSGGASDVLIKMQIGSNTAYVNGSAVRLDAPPQIVKGRTLVPIRFVSENMGAGVTWDPSTKTVTILSSGAATPAVIETRIDGEFEGWDGETVFKLANGQIWQQDSYNYTYHYAYSPDVLIYYTSGRYKMRVEGVDDFIYVVRLK
jgi:hypothetical protein